MNKKTVILLSTTMMSIATAACAFCMAQTANAADTYVDSGTSTAKVTTPPPIENTSSQETNSSETNGIKSSDLSDSSDKDNIKPETNSKPNSNTKTESKLETKSSVKSDAKSDVKLDTKTNVNTVVKTTAKSNVDSVENTDTKAESNIDSKSKVNENSVSPTIFNQALFASSKPAPNQKKQEKTELKVSLCWETMNSDNNKAFIKSDSDFGQLNFENWDFGSTLDSSRKDVKDAFAKIEFQIKDTTDNKVVATTTGTYDPDTATSATKSLGSYDSSHTYEVSVVNSTVPSPYYVTYNNVSVNEGNEFEGDIYHFTWNPSKGSNKTYQNKYFRLNVLEVVYAKDESVADKCFSYTQPQNTDGSYRSDGNWKFTYTTDNIFERLRVKDNVIQFPTTNPTKAGYKFVGWQFYVAKKKNGKPYTSYDRMFDDDKKIIDNTTVDYVPFNEQTTTYPYLFAVIRDSKGVNTFGSKLGTQYCTTNHTFVVFPKWIKEADHTVTFMNEGSEYAKVKVQEGKSINSDEWTDQSMPADPSKTGYTFRGWSTDETGKDKTKEFSAATPVTGDMTVYAIYDLNATVMNVAPTLTLQDKTITEGDSIDLNSLIVSAKDPEDGDITSNVKLTDNGGFDNTKVGSYKITFSVTDNGGATATASATVTVTKKPTPPTPPEPEPTPVPVPEPEQELEPAPALDQPEQSEQQKQPEAKHAAKHLPDTGVGVAPLFESLFEFLFAGFGLSMFKSRRKH
ncbi:primosome assembly protein PriA [Gardnerella vaginalis]|uniref:InlB B-repeat-containing protein n=1 Tax=Gardnerella vaginalis TaxID=2702 RepID=UPI000E213B33|nr:InlB B-repeat-containing protein [Gardnerella vaginalis]RDW96040.1 primosome assembly protein PriA [Gardnerella vaginalis]